MGFQKGIDRKQTILFPLNQEEMIPEEHPVRIIDLFIHHLDIAGYRSENPEGLRNLFRYFVQVMKNWNVVEGETIGIDSSKSCQSYYRSQVIWV